jgi:cobalt-zinc-cadmium efflux system protein
LLTSALNLALDAVPEQIDPAAVRAYLAGLGGVREVHDLHIWAMSTTETALTAHLVMPGGFPGDAFLAEAGHGLHEQFGIGHATLQVETGDAAHPCSQSPEHRV